MMRDKIRLLKDFSVFNYKCHLCNQVNHFFFDCPKFHYVPDQDFLIKRINFSVGQIRVKPFFRRRNRKINALFENFKIHLASLKFTDLGEDEEEEEEMDQSINKNDEEEPPTKFIRSRKSKIVSAAQALIKKENEKKKTCIVNKKAQNYLNIGSVSDDVNLKL